MAKKNLVPKSIRSRKKKKKSGAQKYLHVPKRTNAWPKVSVHPQKNLRSPKCIHACLKVPGCAKNPKSPKIPRIPKNTHRAKNTCTRPKVLARAQKYHHVLKSTRMHLKLPVHTQKYMMRPKVYLHAHKCPSVPKSTPACSKVPARQKYPCLPKSTRMRPKLPACTQKYPRAHKYLHAP